jgi:hypothetical protein
MDGAEISTGTEIRMDQVEQVVQCSSKGDYKGR